MPDQVIDVVKLATAKPNGLAEKRKQRLKAM